MATSTKTVYVMQVKRSSREKWRDDYAEYAAGDLDNGYSYSNKKQALRDLKEAREEIVQDASYDFAPNTETTVRITNTMTIDEAIERTKDAYGRLKPPKKVTASTVWPKLRIVARTMTDEVVE